MHREKAISEPHANQAKECHRQQVPEHEVRHVCHRAPEIDEHRGAGANGCAERAAQGSRMHGVMK
jgi:hypothetical protein